MTHGRGVAQDAPIRMDDIHEPGIAGGQAAIRAVPLEQRQSRIEGRYPGQLNAPLLQLFSGKSCHLGAQTEAYQMDMLGRIAHVDEVSQKSGQITGRHREILHGIWIPRHRCHRTPVH